MFRLSKKSVTLVIMGMVLLLIIFGASRSSTAFQLLSVGLNSVLPTQKPSPLCQFAPTREPALCREITVDGRSYRYAFLPGSDDVRELMLFDVGGPGYSSLATSGLGLLLNALEIERLPDGVGAVLIEEPWVTAPLPSGLCLEAGNSYASAFIGERELNTAILENIHANCADQVYGWSPNAYQAVVNAIAKRHGAPIRSFVGASFGGIRASYLEKSAFVDINRVALVNPLLPQITASDIIDHQSITAKTIANRWSQNAYGIKPATMVAASMSTIGSVSSTDTLKILSHDQIETLANNYAGIYGNNSIALGKIAWFQELCHSGFASSETTRWKQDEQDIRGFLTTLFSGCNNTATGGSRLRHSDAVATRRCIVASEEDLVIPIASIRRVAKTKVHIANGSHTNISGLKHCRETLQL